jgi:hypothetical protein
MSDRFRAEVLGATGQPDQVLLGDVSRPGGERWLGTAVINSGLPGPGAVNALRELVRLANLGVRCEQAHAPPAGLPDPVAPTPGPVYHCGFTAGGFYHTLCAGAGGSVGVVPDGLPDGQLVTSAETDVTRPRCLRALENRRAGGTGWRDKPPLF